MIEPIKPMLASPPKGERLTALAGTHLFDTKLDGLRAIAYLSEDGTCKILNRSMRDVTAQYPELEATAKLDIYDLVLDGEIVAASGSFQDTAMRGKQVKPGDIARAMKTAPVNFVAFDVLHHAGQDLRSQPYEYRRNYLDSLAEPWKVPPTMGWDRPWVTSVVSNDPGFFDQVKALGMEGVIAKRKRSTYRSGRFSDWIKIKATHSLTCVAVGYEPGEGARAHFGAMLLALIGPDGPVPMGRVGTGFTAREITMLKAELDAGRMPLVEIECLNITRDGSLRMPVYKGIRDSELSYTDATLSQLDAIPRSG